jgi:hypothetical protein
MFALALPDKTCRACGQVFNRKRWNNGYLEGAVHYRRRVYCSKGCSGIHQVGREEARQKLRQVAPTDTTLAYIAGLVDGEGCITTGIRSPRAESRELSLNLIMSVCIAMTDESIIKWLQSATGLGRVHFHGTRNERHKDAWMWVCSVSDGVALLEALMPFLRLKKPQASLFLELAEIREKSGRAQSRPDRQLEIAKTMQALNKRGR